MTQVRLALQPGPALPDGPPRRDRPPGAGKPFRPERMEFPAPAGSREGRGAPERRARPQSSTGKLSDQSLPLESVTSAVSSPLPPGWKKNRKLGSALMEKPVSATMIGVPL